MPGNRPIRRSSTQVPEKPGGFSLTAVFSGVMFAVIFIFAAFIVFSLLFVLTPLSDNYIPAVAYVVSFLAVLMGGYRATVRAGGAGLLNGGSVGACYALLAVVAAALLSTSPALATFAWWRPLADIGAGIIGGIWGAGS